MKNSTTRVVLLSSVSMAATFLALPGAAQAQTTTCSQTGTTITCVDGTATVLTATTTPATTTVAGPGLVTVATSGPSTTTYTAAGPIATTNVGAVNLTSTGGPLTFVPTGTTAPVNVSTTGGAGANGVTLNTTGQAATVTVGNISTTGTSSFGVRSNGGTDLTLRTGDITTTGGPTFMGGLASRGISATQQTGVIDIIAGNLTTTDRGLSVVTASSATAVVGNVTAQAAGVLVTTSGADAGNISITTGDVTAANGFGVFGQAISGTGNVVIRTGAVTNALGTGFGGASGVGGLALNATGGVDIGCSTVTSNSPNSAAVSAQSTGTGALIINCGVVTNVGNNAVFAQSSGIPDGGNITINTTSLAATNTAFSTLFAQTAGTGTITVNAGTVTGGMDAAGVGATGIDLATDTGAIDAGYGNVTTVGTALRSTSTGTLNLRGAGATLQTSGAGSTAALLTANGVTGNLGNIVTTGAGAQGAVITSTAPVNLTIGTVATTGNGVTVNAGTSAVTLATGMVTATEAGATGTVINATGPITFTGGRQVANGANALQINGGAGAIDATVAGAATSGTGTAVAITGTGPLTFANTGTIATTGATSSGIAISGVTTAAVNCGNVSTTGDNSPAVVVAANGTTSVTCGTVTTTGANSDAILVTNTAGTTTVTGGTTSATGTGSRGIVVTSSAPAASDLVTVNTGVVTANGNAVVADSTGGANVLVTANGNVTSSNGAAITVTTAGGAATVNQALGTTTSAATDAIRVNNTVGGAINVNARGTLVANNGSGVFVSTDAASADPINVTTNIVRSTGGPGTWGSQVRASAGSGDITITSNGPMTSAGAPGSIFGGILAVTNGTSNRNVTVNVNADIGSPTDRSSASQVLVSGTSSSAKTLAVNIANASIFGGPGAVQVQQNATSLGDVRIVGTGAGTLSATGATGIGINARILNPANPGNILVDVTQNVIGTVQGINATTLGTGTVTVAARGNVTATTGTGITAASGGTTLVTIGAGTTTSGVQGASLQGALGNTLIVNGTLRNTAGTTPYTVLAGGPFTLTLGSTGTIVGPLAFTTGNDTFNNQGTFALPASLDFLAGTDVFNNTGTLNAFSGTSVVSNLETFNNAGGLIDMRDGAGNDIVNLANSNYAATGNARLGIDVVTTGGTILADRLVIGGTTSGTTTVLATLANPIIDPTGALIVDSTLNNVAAGQFVLSGTTNFGLINFALQNRGGDVFLVSNTDARAFDTVFAGRQVRDLWYRSADVYTGYATARRVSFGQERKAPIGFWAQLYGENGKAGDRNRSTTLFGTTLAVSDRIETDYRGAQGGIDFGSANFVVGLTGGYARAKADTNSFTDLVTEGRNYGAYAQFGMTSGIYAGALIKRDDYRTRLNNAAIQAGTVRSRSRSEGIEGEVGLRTGGEGNINFDVGAGLAYVRSKLDTFNFGNITFDADRATSMRGRVHARASFAGDIAPFIEARGFHEFRGDTEFQLRSGSATTTLEGSGKGTWVRIEGGIGGGTGGGPLISAWADLGNTRGYGLRAGFRF